MIMTTVYCVFYKLFLTIPSDNPFSWMSTQRQNTYNNNHLSSTVCQEGMNNASCPLHIFFVILPVTSKVDINIPIYK